MAGISFMGMTRYLKLASTLVSVWCQRCGSSFLYFSRYMSIIHRWTHDALMRLHDHMTKRAQALFRVFTVWCHYKGWATFGLNFKMFRFLAFLAYINKYERKIIHGSLSSLLVCCVMLATDFIYQKIFFFGLSSWLCPVNHLIWYHF